MKCVAPVASPSFCLKDDHWSNMISKETMSACYLVRGFIKFHVKALSVCKKNDKQHHITDD